MLYGFITPGACRPCIRGVCPTHIKNRATSLYISFHCKVKLDGKTPAQFFDLLLICHLSLDLPELLHAVSYFYSIISLLIGQYLLFRLTSAI